MRLTEPRGRSPTPSGPLSRKAASETPDRVLAVAPARREGGLEDTGLRPSMIRQSLQQRAPANDRASLREALFSPPEKCSNAEKEKSAQANDHEK